MVNQTTSTQKLVRPRDNRIIAGVCSGIAEWLGVSTFGMRVLFIILLILPPAAILPYIVLWVLIPNEQRETEDDE